MDWTQTKKAAAARDGGKCLRCLGEATDVHHRHPRQMGGTKDEAINTGLANVVCLCRSCHDWIHAHPQHAYLSGFLLKTGSDPELVSLDTYSGRFMLTADGKIKQIEAANASF